MLELIGFITIGAVVWLAWGKRIKEKVMGGMMGGAVNDPHWYLQGGGYGTMYSTSTSSYGPQGNANVFMTSLRQAKEEKKLADNEAYLYDVYLIYAENLNAPIVKKASAIARGDEDAKIKSGLMKQIESSWDSDYLSILVNQIGVVRFKKKPQEVKIVKEQEPQQEIVTT